MTNTTKNNYPIWCHGSEVLREKTHRRLNFIYMKNKNSMICAGLTVKQIKGGSQKSVLDSIFLIEEFCYPGTGPRSKARSVSWID